MIMLKQCNGKTPNFNRKDFSSNLGTGKFHFMADNLNYS